MCITHSTLIVDVKDIIELRDVSKLYGFGDATTVAVEEVSLRVKKGEFLAVMGPSGSGKSTLMNLIGLLDRPTQGAYLLSGRTVGKFGQRRRAKLRRDNIGFVFQSFNLLPQLTALENVALPLAYRGKPRVRRLKQAGNALERVGLADREYFYPKQLSGGQLQRVAVARALVNNPDIIIADEPTGNLDSGSSRVVMELLADLHKSGHTILMVTHNPELTRYASRVVFMLDGVIIADEDSTIGDVAEIAKKMYFRTRTTEEDDLAGISAIMQAIPQADKLIKKTRKKKPAKKPKAKPRKRKSPAPKKKTEASE
jgi:putative ABC transport system ATP-binding protein